MLTIKAIDMLVACIIANIEGRMARKSLLHILTCRDLSLGN